jgi:hypothetical protein
MRDKRSGTGGGWLARLATWMTEAERDLKTIFRVSCRIADEICHTAKQLALCLVLMLGLLGVVSQEHVPVIRDRRENWGQLPAHRAPACSRPDQRNDTAVGRARSALPHRSLS